MRVAVFCYHPRLQAAKLRSSAKDTAQVGSEAVTNQTEHLLRSFVACAYQLTYSQFSTTQLQLLQISSSLGAVSANQLGS
jgi:hypothetical protein